MRVRQLAAILAAASGLVPRVAVAGDLTFTGSLRFVTNTFLTVRLDDGRVIDARLPKTGPLAAPAIVGQYKLADQVRIACKRISGELDTSVDRYHLLELTQLHFLRPPTPEEVARVEASISWQNGEDLLKPSTVLPAKHDTPKRPEPDGFERVREVNLARIQTMPNFVADELALRSRQAKGSLKWGSAERIESEVVFRGTNAARQHVRINGKPWNTPSAWLPGPNWGVGFGTELGPLFERDCENQFTSEGATELQGRQLIAYGFRTPVDGCFGPSTYGFVQYADAHTGRILADKTERSVIQMEIESDGGPADPGGRNRSVLTWSEVKIGEASYLLPAAEDWTWHSGGTGDTWHVTVQYRNHRHFESATSVRFQEESGRPK